MKRIIYDNIIFSLQKFGGISTYWYELCQRLMKDEQFYPSFIVTDKQQNVLGQTLKIGPGHILRSERKLPLLFDRFRRPDLSKVKIPFIFHSSYNRYTTSPYAKNVTTVHDLIHHKYYKGVRKWLHNSQKGSSLRTSSGIIAVSNNTKRDLQHFFPELDPDAIHVVHNGVSEQFYTIKQTHYKYLLPEAKLSERYLLCVSSREPYKNFDFVVDVVNRLPDFKLYIVGANLTRKEADMLNSRLPGRYEVFSSIPTEALNELYNHAYALLYPSSYEGFGLPLVEAMRASCPFIALNSSSIPEVSGDAGILLDELDVKEFIGAVEGLETRRSELILKGHMQSAMFSWDKCYNQTVKVYETILGE